jgi:hypothetical protein
MITLHEPPFRGVPRLIDCVACPRRRWLPAAMRSVTVANYYQWWSSCTGASSCDHLSRGPILIWNHRPKEPFRGLRERPATTDHTARRVNVYVFA